MAAINFFDLDQEQLDRLREGEIAAGSVEAARLFRQAFFQEVIDGRHRKARASFQIRPSDTPDGSGSERAEDPPPESIFKTASEVAAERDRARELRESAEAMLRKQIAKNQAEYERRLIQHLLQNGSVASTAVAPGQITMVPRGSLLNQIQPPLQQLGAQLQAHHQAMHQQNLFACLNGMGPAAFGAGVAAPIFPSGREYWEEAKDTGTQFGEVIAYRCWEVRRYAEPQPLRYARIPGVDEVVDFDISDAVSLRLGSMARSDLWHPTEPMEGDPQKNYEGVHAFKTMQECQSQYSYNNTPCVFGQVALWGDIVEHAKGYRAEFGRPHKFLAYKGEPLCGSPTETIIELNRIYGIGSQFAEKDGEARES